LEKIAWAEFDLLGPHSARSAQSLESSADAWGITVSLTVLVCARGRVM
jgi:hypothetical protein